MSEMSDKGLFDFMDNNNKDFYKEWYVECCEMIVKETDKDMSKSDCMGFLHHYFNQVKSGECN